MRRQSFFQKTKFLILLFVVSVCIVTAFVVNQKQKTSASIQTSIQTAVETSLYKTELSGIIAKAYFVYDVNENKVLFAKNEHASLPLASVTKLMTGFVVMNHLPKNAVVTIAPQDLGYDGNGGRLFVGEKWTPQMLLNFSLILSSNDGMMALAHTLDQYEGANASNTVMLMNDEAKKLGMKDSVFMNPSGLDISATTS